MDHEFLAIAIVRSHAGHDEDVVDLLQNFYAMLSRKGYSRDELFRSEKDSDCFVNLRYWKSDDARREAAEDPDVHRFWHSLSEIATVEKVYELLKPISLLGETAGQ